MLFKKKVELFDAIRWDGQNTEEVEGTMGCPVKKAGFGSLEIQVGPKETVKVKKNEFAVRSRITEKITTCGLDEFERTYEGAR